LETDRKPLEVIYSSKSQLRNLPKRSEMDVSKFKKHLAQDALAKSGKVLKRVVGKPSP